MPRRPGRGGLLVLLLALGFRGGLVSSCVPGVPDYLPRRAATGGRRRGLRRLRRFGFRRGRRGWSGVGIPRGLGGRRGPRRLPPRRGGERLCRGRRGGVCGGGLCPRGRGGRRRETRGGRSPAGLPLPASAPLPRLGPP